MTDETVDDGASRFRQLLTILPAADPRDDIDTASLVNRFPHVSSVSVDDVAISGTGGPVPARRYRGTYSTGIGLVWVHGGAFVAGSLDMPESHWIGLELASRGFSVLALDYRKALGGVTFPAASDDVLSGWMAAVSDSEVLGTDITRLHFGGASAGANLSAGVIVRLVTEAQQLPASLMLFYPVLHSEVPAPSAAAAAAAVSIPDDLRFTAEFMKAVNLNYVGDPTLLDDPVAFPANAVLTEFPPTLLVNSEADDLRPSGEEFALQLANSGVRVEADSEPGTVHGYLDHPGLPEAVASIERMSEWMVRHSV